MFLKCSNLNTEQIKIIIIVKRQIFLIHFELNVATAINYVQKIISTYSKDSTNTRFTLPVSKVMVNLSGNRKEIWRGGTTVLKCRCIFNKGWVVTYSVTVN